MFSNIPINLLSETQLGRQFGFFIQRLVDGECGWREGLRLRSYACICICQSVQSCFLLYFSLPFAGSRTFVQSPLYLVFLCVDLCFIRCGPVKASLRADPLLNSGGNDGVCMYQQAWTLKSERERHPEKKEAEEAEVERGGLQCESERQRRDGDQGGRTVVDLSTDFCSSQRKRPLSFDCELNHVRGTILKWHAEGGDRGSQRISGCSYIHRFDCGLEFLTFTLKIRSSFI